MRTRANSCEDSYATSYERAAAPSACSRTHLSNGRAVPQHATSAWPMDSWTRDVEAAGVERAGGGIRARAVSSNASATVGDHVTAAAPHSERIGGQSARGGGSALLRGLYLAVRRRAPHVISHRARREMARVAGRRPRRNAVPERQRPRAAAASAACVRGCRMCATQRARPRPHCSERDGRPAT